MNRYVSLVGLAVMLVFAPVARTASGPDVTDTKMLAQPAVSADRIAFIYAADLWVADLDGRNDGDAPDRRDRVRVQPQAGAGPSGAARCFPGSISAASAASASAPS